MSLRSAQEHERKKVGPKMYAEMTRDIS